MDKEFQDIKYTNEKGEDIVIRQVKINCITFLPTYIRIYYNTYSAYKNDYSIHETLVLPILRGFKLIID